MNRALTKTILLCCLLIMFQSGVPLYGQPGSRHYEQLSVKNGLSSDWVNFVLQDRQGFYWISTNDGLNRFDGSSVKIFRHNRNDSSSISHNTCSAIVEADDGNIWVATMNGVSCYIKKTGRFRNYYLHHTGINDNIINVINTLAKDGEGSIWAGSYGLWKIDPDTDSITGYFHQPENSASISDNESIGSVLFDKSNQGLWVKPWRQ